jgi:ubiquinone/menaquinone biosynthesis C-methylase UbiE
MPDNRIIEFFNNNAAEWDTTRSEKDTLKLEKMAGRLNLEPGSFVLDAGTGTGVFLPCILDRIGAKGRVTALDFAENMLKLASSKNGSHNIFYLRADIMGLPLAENTFDRVVCYSSFPHFSDKLQALREIIRVLKPGGKLAVCHTSSRAHINSVHSRQPAVKDHIIPDSDEMRDLMLKAGFEPVQIEDTHDSYLAMADKQA